MKEKLIALFKLFGVEYTEEDCCILIQDKYGAEVAFCFDLSGNFKSWGVSR